MKSKYKIGNIVRIKDKYDPECGPDSYTCTFLSDMLENYGGKIAQIVDVIPLSRPQYRKLTTEQYKYVLSIDPVYSWSAEMFESDPIIRIDQFTN